MKMMDMRDGPERLGSLEVNTMAYAWNRGDFEREDKILNKVEKISQVEEKKYMKCDINLFYCRT